MRSKLDSDWFNFRQALEIFPLVLCDAVSSQSYRKTGGLPTHDACFHVNFVVMATGFVGSTKSFPFSFDVDVEDDEQGRSTPRLNKRIGEYSPCVAYIGV